MLAADEAHFSKHGEPLFSSHMLDLSEEPKLERTATYVAYLKRMAAIGCFLEVEAGLTDDAEDNGGDGIDNPALYTQPQEVW